MGKIYYNGVDYSAPVVSGVSGIKGNAETIYRTGNVNLTPANLGAAPISHAVTTTTYGKGTGAIYGHVKLSDTYTSSVGDASSGVAASQKALFDAYSSLNSNIGVINLGFDDTKADSWKDLIDKKIQIIKSQNKDGVFLIRGGWNLREYGITIGQNINGDVIVFDFSSFGIYAGIKMGNETYTNYRIYNPSAY